MSADESGPVDRPLLRVVHGAPTDAELAALVAVLSAGGAADEPQPGAGSQSQWAAPERALRAAVSPGGWWVSGLPR